MKFGGTIQLERALYDALGTAWLAAIRVLPASCDSALIVAHSPGIEEAAALLCGASPGAFDIPTAGLLAFDDEVDHWRDVGGGGAALRWFLRPKLVERL
jgi:phosphohistidine phosphatase SixA